MKAVVIISDNYLICRIIRAMYHYNNSTYRSTFKGNVDARKSKNNVYLNHRLYDGNVTKVSFK